MPFLSTNSRAIAESMSSSSSMLCKPSPADLPSIPTPLTFSVLGQLSGKHGGHVDGAPERATVALAADGTRDWPRVAVAAAANSLAPGQNVMANTDDFLSHLLTLAGVRGSDGIAIDPSGRTVSLEAKKKGERTEFDLPKSVRKSLVEQLHACADFKRMEPSTVAGDVVDWSGQKLSIASEVADEGGAFTVQFLGIPILKPPRQKCKPPFRKFKRRRLG
jgi:hypothetical protein